MSKRNETRMSLPTSKDGKKIPKMIEKTTAGMVSLISVHDLPIFSCLSFKVRIYFKVEVKKWILWNILSERYPFYQLTFELHIDIPIRQQLTYS